MAAKALSGLLQRLRAAAPRPGEVGETLACRHLESRGLVVVARNFRCRSGEVDVGFIDTLKAGGVVVVPAVEGFDGDHVCLADGSLRRADVVIAATGYRRSESPLRFDVVCIDWMDDGRPRIRHDAAAFDADGR